MCRPNQSGAEAAGTSDRDGLAFLKHTPHFQDLGVGFGVGILLFFPPTPQRVILIIFFPSGCLTGNTHGFRGFAPAVVSPAPKWSGNNASREALT